MFDSKRTIFKHQQKISKHAKIPDQGKKILQQSSLPSTLMILNIQQLSTMNSKIDCLTKCILSQYLALPLVDRVQVFDKQQSQFCRMSCISRKQTFLDKRKVGKQGRPCKAIPLQHKDINRKQKEKSSEICLSVNDLISYDPSQADHGSVNQNIPGSKFKWI